MYFVFQKKIHLNEERTPEILKGILKKKAVIIGCFPISFVV